MANTYKVDFALSSCKNDPPRPLSPSPGVQGREGLPQGEGGGHPLLHHCLSSSATSFVQISFFKALMLSFITVTLFYVEGSCLWFEIIDSSKSSYIRSLLCIVTHRMREETISELEENLRSKLHWLALNRYWMIKCGVC